MKYSSSWGYPRVSTLKKKKKNERKKRKERTHFIGRFCASEK
jgi:hypothetical protein